MLTRSSQPKSRPIRPVMLLLLALPLLAITARLIPGPRMLDDAYITFRYARNIVQGLGFVYNPGEHVMGTTTPLYTLLMAGIGQATGSTEFPPVALAINALCDGVNALLLYKIMRRLGRHPAPAAVLGVLWALAPHSVNASIGGMETSVYMLMMLCAWATWLWDRTRLSAALTALATLTRPDALIWAGPLGLAMIWQHWRDHPAEPLLKRLPWAEGSIFAAVLTPWVVYSMTVFGSPLPHSIVAKVISTTHEGYSALLILAGSFSIPFFELILFGLNATILGIFIYPGLALLGAIVMIRADWRSAPIGLFFWLYLGTFAVTNFIVYGWYHVPPLAGFLISIVAGAWAICRRLASPRLAPAAMAAIGLVWVFFSLNAWTPDPGYAQARPTPRITWNRIVLIYQEVAKGLRATADKDATIAATDIGVLGWDSGLRILDTVGLVSPEADDYYPVPESLIGDEGYAIPPDLIMDKRPEYVVIMEQYGRLGLLRDPRFMREYKLVERHTVDATWGDLVVYQLQE